MSLADIDGVAHRPDGTPAGVVLLTHGAGGNRDAPLLQRVCATWADHGWLAIRYNLPFRRRRPSGPPSGSATGDQDGVRGALAWARTQADGPLIAGGHSYGGRMTSMVATDAGTPLDVLSLFSYPLHPPGKPERSRTGHLEAIRVATVFVHGGKDPFGSLDELHAAAALIPARTELVEIADARHDLASKTLDVAELAVAAARRLAARPGD
ncbi:alpha/beta hydrolase [Mycobacterium koreense]|uniref:Alpha/beta hydrolase n=1 Tax=Mycolicibacillus koreensis TaxID=1069220 RepID=A0A7I7SF17_9MYCO|nr:alpha/beta family hydrolase [Mycolicibacillus koreensis]MCV7248424.1 alpha/beta hydrolase [Mycolicibacillus koreensis]OSC24887.1 alpha/beta hydrolase [Mycolicibacillus koreensis]BBY55368.1 hypothetical protein MKOR_26190 [Mycolicibacillus koreensis]